LGGLLFARARVLLAKLAIEVIRAAFN